MKLGPRLAVFLTPDKHALQFAVRGLIAMALALFVAMSMQLERPYWALISAIFLQIRPETGLVIEKGVCQIAGTLAGGVIGVMILAGLLSYPALAIAVLALWVGLNAAVSALVRHFNLIYGLAIACVTAVLIVVFTLVDPSAVDSQAVFRIATERVSEIAVGAVCATLAAMLLWPLRVKDMLMAQARDAINQTFDYMDLELSPESSREQRHQKVDTVLQPIVALDDDSSAAVFEGPEGPGRARAVTRLCQKLLSLIAVIQVFGRFRRNHFELIGPELDALLETLRNNFQRMRLSGSHDQARRMAQTLRRELQQWSGQSAETTPIQRRLVQTARQMVGDLIVVLEAYRAIDQSEQTRLRSRNLAPYRDPLVAAVTALRAALVFLVGASVWIATASPAAVVMMILPVIYSIVIARVPSPPMAMRQILVGAAIAVPVALFFGLGLLARAPPHFELLMMVFGTPLFIALLVIPSLDTRFYGLGFGITYILLIRPSNPMLFAVDQFVSTGLAIIVAISMVYIVFRLITAPSARLLQRRLIASTARDLRRIATPGETGTEEWFNARMAERLMRLSAYDRARPAAERHLTNLGLAGLNLGRVSLGLQRRIRNDPDARIGELASQWQQALASAYEDCSHGQYTGHFDHCGARLLSALRQSGQLDDARLELTDGTMERLALTLQRIASAVASAQNKDTKKSLNTLLS